jgi:hypothetical protein
MFPFSHRIQGRPVARESGAFGVLVGEEVGGCTDKGVVVVCGARFQEGNLGFWRCSGETACENTACCAA